MSDRHPVLEAAIPILPVNDLDASIRYYEKVLGFRLAWKWGDPPSLASVCRDRVELNLSANQPKGSFNVARAYIQMSGVEEYYAQITKAGAVVAIPLAFRVYGMKDCRILDPDRNELSFGESKGADSNS